MSIQETCDVHLSVIFVNFKLISTDLLYLFLNYYEILNKQIKYNLYKNNNKQKKKQQNKVIFFFLLFNSLKCSASLSIQFIFNE
jgi:hypothetical protein